MGRRDFLVGMAISRRGLQRRFVDEQRLGRDVHRRRLNQLRFAGRNRFLGYFLNKLCVFVK